MDGDFAAGALQTSPCSSLIRVDADGRTPEVLLRAAQRDWAVSKVTTRALLDEARAER